MAKSRLLVVTGMHRSGTSALTEALADRGLALSRHDALVKAHPSNPRGHFEDSRIVAMNDRILAHGGASWLNPWPLRKFRPNDDLLSDIDRCWSVVERESTTLIKDPRFCLTWHWWQSAWTDREVTYVHIVRHPVEVAASLRDRNGIPQVLAELLWHEYVVSFLAVGEPSSSVIVDFASLVSDPMKTVGSIVARIGSSAFPDSRSKMGTSPVDPSLRHHSSDVRPDLKPVDILWRWLQHGAQSSSKEWAAPIDNTLASVASSLAVMFPQTFVDPEPMTDEVHLRTELDPEPPGTEDAPDKLPSITKDHNEQFRRDGRLLGFLFGSPVGPLLTKRMRQRGSPTLASVRERRAPAATPHSDGPLLARD